MIHIITLRGPFKKKDITEIGLLQSDYNLADALTKPDECPQLEKFLDKGKLGQGVAQWVVRSEHQRAALVASSELQDSRRVHVVSPIPVGDLHTDSTIPPTISCGTIVVSHQAPSAANAADTWLSNRSRLSTLRDNRSPMGFGQCSTLRPRPDDGLATEDSTRARDIGDETTAATSAQRSFPIQLESTTEDYLTTVVPDSVVGFETQLPVGKLRAH